MQGIIWAAMMSETTAAPTETFYESTRHYRNLKSALLLVVVPLFALLPTWVMLRGGPPGHYFTKEWFFGTIISLAFLFGLAKLLYNVTRDVRQPVRVDTAGGASAQVRSAMAGVAG